MDVRSQLGTSRTPEAVDLRRHPRFKLEVDIRLYPRDSAVVRGHTVDISESGISAMLREEVPLGGMVRLEFTLPLGEVEVLGMVRHRSAFRYGFQFVEASSANASLGEPAASLRWNRPERRLSAFGVRCEASGLEA